MAGDISGIKWNDLNNNGIKDANEAVLAGWTIYLDQNKNGQLDVGEKSTITDASGNYKFTGLTAGAYTVAEVQKPGWTQTFPTNSGESTLIPIKDRRDLIFDPSRKYLYITTSDGDVERFDINAKSLLTPFDVGNSLNGGDITSDGSALYIAENQRGATQGFVRKVNLSNGTVTNITYNLESWDDKPWDLSISSNGKGLLSLTGQWTPLYDLNLSNDTLTKRNDLQFGIYYAGANINRSPDRNLLFLTDGSDSSIFTYDPATNKFPKQVETNSNLSNSLSVVNRNGSLIAVEVGTGISIMDANLKSLENLSNVDGGMVFDPLKDVLYAADSAKDQIVAFDTNTWKELYRLNIGEDIKNDWDNSSKPLNNGVMTVSDDGKYLFMSTPSGVRMLNLNESGGSGGTHAVNVSEGQAVTNINFGNKQVASETGTINGIKWNDTDSDGVRDVGEAALSGWTIYLDQNQNGQLDTGEKSTTTDANGKYTFSELTPSSYTVAEVQKTGWQQTFPSTGGAIPSVLIPIKDRRYLVFDPTRNLLYITTSDGDVERYNIATQTLLTPYDVGNSLNGGDITPDGNNLYVAEGQRGATQGFIRKVNLSTGSVTNITYDLDFGEGSALDLNIASNGKGFLSTNYEGSGWTPFRELNLSNDTLSIRKDAGGSGFGGEVSAPAYIFRGSDRNLFFMTEGNISSGPIFTYNALTNTFPKKTTTDTFLGSVLAAINRDSSLIATEVGTGISIMDANFTAIENLTNVDGGMAFDPVKDVLYAANTKSDQIIAFDTNTWKELSRFNIGEDIGNSWDNDSKPLGNGVMTVSDDGKYLFMSTPSGVRMFNLSGSGSNGVHKVNVSAGQVVSDINFGNHQTTSTAKLSIDNVTVIEGNSGTKDAVFTVSLDKASTETITVTYATGDDTAIAAQDYTAKQGLLTFTPGQTKQQILVPVIGDTLTESDETFKVNLTKATNAEIVTSVGLGTILNDDSFSLPQLSIGNVKVTEGDSGAKDTTFTVSLSAPSTQTVTVNYITADRTAIADQDFKQTSGILTFTPGQTSQEIAIPIIGDTIVESDETFKVNLSKATNAAIAVASGLGTILNDDSFSLPQLSIGNVKVTEGDSGAQDTTFTVSLSAPSTQTVTVNFITDDETAIGDEDFKQTSGILTFTPGQTSQEIAIPIIGDTLIEPDETFKVNLSKATNAAIAVASGLGTILNDDSSGGNSGNDSLVGTPGHDTLDGGLGHDTIEGLAGHDSIQGGSGHDWINGGDGHDTVDGGSGHDIIYGAKGNDILIGGEGDDAINIQVRQFPWHLWDLLERYPTAEIALGAIAYERPTQVIKQTSTNAIKILAILGNQDGIDIQKDRQLLEKLPNAETTFLVEPQRQDLTDQLWEQSWDILFFAGHSKTEGETGRIYINQTDSLTIEEVELAIKKAVERGLKIAIFNSCDGLGLARKLEQLNIPQIIVMREPVPDQVAQEFLKYFIKSFASGTSFYLAVQEARKKLEGLEGDFPCASWLPAICQNPATVPPTWQQLRGSDRLTFPFQFKTSLIASLSIAILVMAVRQMGILQALEFQAFDLLMRLRPNEGIDERLLVVEATAEDINRYGFPLPDGILAQAIAKLELHQPRVIGLDIFRSQPIQFGNSTLLSQFQHNHNLIAICSVSEANNPNKPGIKPPPKLPENRLGFSDVLVDPDGILRRHLVFMTPQHTDPCATNYSLSVRLALDYLAADGIYPQLIGNHRVKLGKTVLKPLKIDTGGYQNLDTRGFQLLLNYRASAEISRRVRLSEVLAGQIQPDWVKNRIVTIGVTAPNSSDDFSTPYSAMKWPYKKMPGLILQAQMVSQIISAVLDNRPILWVWNVWGEAVWVWGWAIVGGAIACYCKKILYGVLTAGVAVTILSGLCLVFLVRGGWVPLVPSALALVATGGCATLGRTLILHHTYLKSV